VLEWIFFREMVKKMKVFELGFKRMLIFRFLKQNKVRKEYKENILKQQNGLDSPDSSELPCSADSGKICLKQQKSGAAY
jgi:hypothetical protein